MAMALPKSPFLHASESSLARPAAFVEQKAESMAHINNRTTDNLLIAIKTPVLEIRTVPICYILLLFLCVPCGECMDYPDANEKPDSPTLPASPVEAYL
jgi:hypothetical protein